MIKLFVFCGFRAVPSFNRELKSFMLGVQHTNVDGFI